MKVADVRVDTIRFYQKIGLIKSAARSVGGYRLFDGEDIRDLTFVRHAQELRFSLTEVKELLALRQKHHVCSEVQSMLKRKPGDVREKINSLPCALFAISVPLMKREIGALGGF
jgi:DNA-binding transcriptional MerR regulator